MTTDEHRGEVAARRAIEDAGYLVHSANVLFRQNCPNIDLVVYGPKRAAYVQVKTSTKPAGKDCLVIDGSPWTEAQLYEGGAIFNKHANEFAASYVVLADLSDQTRDRFYVFPPSAVEERLRQRGRAWAETPKRDGGRRSIGFRKELPRQELSEWENAWHLLSECVS